MNAYAPWLLAAVAALFWAVLAATYGPWWTPDTMTYLTAADALLDGTLRTGLHQRPMTEAMPPLTGWPPGYPALLAPLRAVGLSATAATLTVSGLCFALATGLLARLLQVVSGDPRSGWGALALLAFPPFLEIGLRGWSEGPWFVAFLALCLALAQRRNPLLVGVLSGLLFLFRHASLAMLPLTLVAVAWRGTRSDVARAGLGQGLTAGPWVLYSLGVSGRIGYPYPPTDSPLSELVDLFVDGLARSSTTPWLAVADSWPVVWVVLAGALWVVLLALRRPKASTDIGIVGFVLVAGVLHVGTYLVVRLRHYLDDPDPRILFPLTFAVLFACLVHARRWPRAVPSACFALALTGLAHHVVHPDPAFDWVTRARFAPQLNWIEAHTRPDDLVLGLPHSVTHFHTGRPSLGPLQPPYGEPFTAEELQRVRDRWPGRVVWLLRESSLKRAREDGRWTVADHPDARALEPAGDGFRAWTLVRAPEPPPTP